MCSAWNAGGIKSLQSAILCGDHACHHTQCQFYYFDAQILKEKLRPQMFIQLYCRRGPGGSYCRPIGEVPLGCLHAPSPSLTLGRCQAKTQHMRSLIHFATCSEGLQQSIRWLYTWILAFFTISVKGQVLISLGVSGFVCTGMWFRDSMSLSLAQACTKSAYRCEQFRRRRLTGSSYTFSDMSIMSHGRCKESVTCGGQKR